MTYLLESGFTLEILDEHLSKHSVGIEATDVAYSDAHEVTDKIKVKYSTPKPHFIIKIFRFFILI